jgi:hypothetical protein
MTILPTTNVSSFPPCALSLCIEFGRCVTDDGMMCDDDDDAQSNARREFDDGVTIRLDAIIIIFDYVSTSCVISR